LNVQPLSLPEVLLIQPELHRDERGRFIESWSTERYLEVGVREGFVQDNVSWSESGVLRGLHVQSPYEQGKLVSVLRGEVFDVAVDVRRGSPTFGSWTSVHLSADPAKQLWIPCGFAHGFAVVSDEAIVSYKCTARYAPEAETTILWNDPALAIQWPVEDPRLSEKDRRGTPLREIPAERLPVYTPVAGP
jgi:dTDP-4-dehydrorhamnose 3,5-epimerase